jgi:hypothetical protein
MKLIFCCVITIGNEGKFINIDSDTQFIAIISLEVSVSKF